MQEDKLIVNRLIGREQYCGWLYVAAQYGSVETAKLLLDANASVNEPCELGGATPLLIAVCHRDYAMVDLLLQQPEICVATADFFGDNPLRCAAMIHSATMVQQLLWAKASVDQLDLALVSAAGHCCYDVFARHSFRTHRYFPPAGQRSPCRHDEIVIALLDAGADVTATPAALVAAVTAGRLSTVKLLLAAGAKVARFSLELAVCLDNTAIVKELLPSVVVSKRHTTAVVSCALISAVTSGASINCLVMLLARQSRRQFRVPRLAASAALRHQMPARRRDAVSAGQWRRRFAQRQFGRAEPHQANGTPSRSCEQRRNTPLFYCPFCGWEGMCCPKCRKKYCGRKCDKFEGEPWSIRPFV